MAHHEISPEELKRLEQEFASFDLDSSKSIDRSELKKIIKSLGEYKDEKQVDDLMSEVDTDKSGQIDFKEFVWIVQQIRSGNSKSKFGDLHKKQRQMIEICNFTVERLHELRREFDSFDKDGSGSIDLGELETVLRHLNEYKGPEHLDRLVTVADKDGSKSIEFNEFCILLYSSMSGKADNENFAAIYAKQQQMMQEIDFDEDMLALLKVEFNSYDADHSGSIDFDELTCAFKHLKVYKGPEHTQQLIDSIDKDKSGKIEFFEFCWLICQIRNNSNQGQDFAQSFEKSARHAAELQKLKQEFAMFDMDCSKSIDRNELKLALKNMGEFKDEAQVDALLKEVDVDGSGTIEFGEFIFVIFQVREGHSRSAFGRMHKKQRDMIEMCNFTPQQLHNLRDEFDSFDRDKSGSIDAKEVETVLKHMNEYKNPEQVAALLAAADKDGNGTIEFNEFCCLVYLATHAKKDDVHGFGTAYKKQQKLMRDIEFDERIYTSLAIEFNSFDTDHSGSIDYNELETAFKRMGVFKSKEHLQGLIREVDLDGSGKIEFYEFCWIMSEIRKHSDKGKKLAQAFGKDGQSYAASAAAAEEQQQQPSGFAALFCCCFGGKSRTQVYAAESLPESSASASNQQTPPSGSTPLTPTPAPSGPLMQEHGAAPKS